LTKLRKNSFRSVLAAATFLLAGAAAAWLAAAQSAATQDAGQADTWLGINHGNRAVPDFIADVKDVQLHMVREGFNAEPDADIDAKVDAYVAAGIEMHVSLNMRGAGINVDDYPTWLANYKQRCVELMTAYKGKVHYYIVGNEPDKKDPFTGKLTPEQAVDFCRMAYEASRQVDPSGGIKIESPPLSSPDSSRDYLKKMLAAGLTDCCDYVGLHAYSSQINDGRLNEAWKWTQAQGGTQKPMAISELGISTAWAPKDFTDEQKRQWQADFVDQAYVQLKRYGFANAILFESSSSSKDPGSFALLRDGTTDRNKLEPAYSDIQNHFTPMPLRDGDFESANDPKHQWVVYDDPSDGTWDMSAYDFQAPEGRHGSCLKIDTNGSGRRIVRQVVSDITPGQPVTISAWAYTSDGNSATLKAEGYNATAGAEEAVAATTGKGAWRPLSVTVTPTNSWVVIELSAIPARAPGSVVKFDDVSVQNISVQKGGE
jgi:hypothetical protein